MLEHLIFYRHIGEVLWRLLEYTCAVSAVVGCALVAFRIISLFPPRQRKPSITPVTNDVNSLARCGSNFTSILSNPFNKWMPRALPLKLILGECHRPPLMNNQHWLWYWLVTVRQPAITWASVDRDVCLLWCHSTKMRWIIIKIIPSSC